MERSVGHRHAAVAADHTTARATSVNEHEVRAAAGMTMVIGAVAFAYAYFAKQYVPVQVAASVFWGRCVHQGPNQGIHGRNVNARGQSFVRHHDRRPVEKRSK
jgi:hypothetical protein